MTAIDTAPRPAQISLPGSAPAPARPGLVRLIGLELRKMVDTRAGFWLLLVMALGALAVVAVQLRWGAAEEATFAAFFDGLLTPASFLLPVLGILSVTNEWTHRTALATFTLVPQRPRVVAAKLGAAVVLATASLLVTLLASAVGNLLAVAFDKGDGSWDLSPYIVLHTLLWHGLSVVMGVAFGMLLTGAALAISVYFVLPMAWSVVGLVVTGLKGIAPWTDVDMAMNALTSDATNLTGWVRVLTSALLWIGLPLLLGSVRLMRREIK
jgi:ABC-2 type transport system permease protein